MLNAAPNAAHKALAALEAAHPHFMLITQNVDGLHQRAGSRQVVELHGSLHQMRCLECSGISPIPPDADGVMRCRVCGGVARPHIVWFGELLPEEAWRQAEAAAARAGVMLVVGTSAQVYPAAGLIQRAAAAGADVAEINPEPSALAALSRWALRLPAGEALPRLLREAGLPGQP